MYHHRPHLSHRKRGIVEYAVMGILTYFLYKILCLVKNAINKITAMNNKLIKS